MCDQSMKMSMYYCRFPMNLLMMMRTTTTMSLFSLMVLLSMKKGSFPMENQRISYHDFLHCSDVVVVDIYFVEVFSYTTSVVVVVVDSALLSVLVLMISIYSND